MKSCYVNICGWFIFILHMSAFALPPDSLETRRMVYADFRQAASMSTPAVVHIKTYSDEPVKQPAGSLEDFFRDYYGNNDRGYRGFEDKDSRLLASGSGVIISRDGLIITNNHIVENSKIIEVVLNDKRSFHASLIGADVATDIALIRIGADDLVPIRYGDSDSVSVGDWVMAVGNPFNLTSTVTAGIVSAKGRNLNILGGNSQMAIESFIQTDAAVNPGNSGGALVDLNGCLVGINTAIASPTGAYAGYSFAVPVNLVKKVVFDLQTYRKVQRGLLGVLIRDLNAELAKEKGLNNLNGVYVQDVNDNSAAYMAGIKSGDIITSVNGVRVNTPAQLQEVVALFRPGDSIQIEIRRANGARKTSAVLRSANGTTMMIPYGRDILENSIGASVGDLEKDELKKLKLSAGVKVMELRSGKFADAGMQNGFIITHVDKKVIKTVDELISALEEVNEKGMMVEGFYPGGEKAFYAISLSDY